MLRATAHYHLLCLPALAAMFCSCGGDPSFVPVAGDVLPGGDTNDPVSGSQDPQAGLDAPPSGTDGPLSVGDVTIELIQRGIDDKGFPGAGAVRARVANESTISIEVTLRFIREASVVHLAFLQVSPGTATTVASPESADEVRISGQDDRGIALPTATFVNGRDFSADQPAVYRAVLADAQDPDAPEEVEPDPGSPSDPQPPPQDDGAGDGDEIAPPEPPYVPPQIRILSPNEDTPVRLGERVLVRWEDSSSLPRAVVLPGLRPVGSTQEDAFIQLAPGVTEALDGINDQLWMVIEGVAEQAYEVTLIIDDGRTRQIAVAPGTLTVFADPGNHAPTIRILEPSETRTARVGDVLTVAWEDEDPDDNATISFSLVPAEGSPPGAPSFVIGGPFAEDPDGAGADAASLVLSNVLPGRYDLTARIDDGDLEGTARVPLGVIIEPDPENIAPSIRLTEPAPQSEDIRLVEPGRNVQVSWSDDDADDNALISLLLDPDVVGEPDGDEILLVAAIAEDPDGVADALLLGIPEDPELLPHGIYRVLAAITDGVSTTWSYAPAPIEIAFPKAGGPELPQLDLTPPEGEEHVYLRLGQKLVVRVDTSSMRQAVQTRFFLSQVDPLGGNFRRELRRVVSDDGQGPGDVVVLETVDADVRNDVYPREFRLQMEVYLESAMIRVEAAGSIWILQEVDVVRAEPVGFECTESGRWAPSGGGPEGALQLEWYGGGFVKSKPDEEEPRRVRFWLSRDGKVPADGVEDATHAMVLDTPASVDVVREDHVPYERFVNLEPGRYWLVPVITPLPPEVMGSVLTPNVVLDICREAENAP
jgi:hypothetical protein